MSVCLAAALAVGAAVPTLAAATAGSSPADAMPLSGTAYGTLPAGGVAWYSYYHNPSLNDELMLTTSTTLPISTDAQQFNDGGVFVNVDWQGQPTDQNAPQGLYGGDLPGYIRVGQSGQYQLPSGLSYWEQDKSTLGRPYALEVVNDTGAPVAYALTLGQSNNAVTYTDTLAAPYPKGTEVPPASPAPATTSTGTTSAGTTSAGTGPANAAALNGTADGTLAPGGVAWYSYYHNPSLNDELMLTTSTNVPISTDAQQNNNGGVYVNVEWQGQPTDPNAPIGQNGVDVPGLIRVGQSGQYQLPAGLSYWEQQKSTLGRPYLLEVVNSTGETVHYALTLNQSNNAVAYTDTLAAPYPKGS
jgi:hypothetical protein